MALSQADRVKLKAHIDANTNTVVVGGVTMQIKDVPNTEDTNEDVANWYNQFCSPVYWIWKTQVTRAEIYHTVGPEGNTIWNWNTYKAQNATEQNAWTQMFMGDNAPAYLLNFREGVFRIFGGAVGTDSGKQRVHTFGVCRRNARQIEKVIAVAVATIGGILVSVDNGNDGVVNNRGTTTNPDYVGADIVTNRSEVTTARKGE